MIIGFTGLKGAGKDTAAEYLVKHHGFVRYAFADEVYAQVAQAFNVPDAALRSREWKEVPHPALALKHCSDDAFVTAVNELSAYVVTDADMNAPRTSTFTVQRWATEYRRKQLGANYWASIVAAKLLHLPFDTKVVLSDVREDHEVGTLMWFANRCSTDRGSTSKPLPYGIAQIVSPATHHTGHSSDNGLSLRYIDKTINNKPGDFAGLYQQVEEFLQEIKCKTP